MYDQIIQILYNLGSPFGSGEFAYNIPIYDFTVHVIATTLTAVCFLLPFAFIIRIVRRY